MNGYDFDDTIFRSNSMRRFYFFCALRLPYLFVLFAPVIAVAVVLRALRILDKNKYLFMMEWFIACVPNAEKFAVKFWDKNFKRIKSWYLEQKQDDDVIVSASPYFLINEACKRLGVRCIATNLDPHARLHGKHCHGVTKVEMYREQFGDKQLAAYYSDSLSDTPMFKYAERGYLVKGDVVTLLYENGEKIGE